MHVCRLRCRHQFFDNAEVYAGGESEVVMGDIISKAGWERDSFIISSKVFWGGNKPTQKVSRVSMLSMHVTPP